MRSNSPDELRVSLVCWVDGRVILARMVGTVNVKRAVALALKRFNLPETFTEETLVAAVSEARGRPLKLKKMMAGFGSTEGLSALWLPTNNTDYVLFGPGGSALHSQQFVLHEIAHIMLGHDEEEEAVSFSHLFPDIPESVMKRALARHDMDNEFELAAELLADRLAARLRQGEDSTRFAEVFG